MGTVNDQRPPNPHNRPPGADFFIFFSSGPAATRGVVVVEAGAQKNARGSCRGAVEVLSRLGASRGFPGQAESRRGHVDGELQCISNIGNVVNHYTFLYPNCISVVALRYSLAIGFEVLLIYAPALRRNPGSSARRAAMRASAAHRGGARHRREEAACAANHRLFLFMHTKHSV